MSNIDQFAICISGILWSFRKDPSPFLSAQNCGCSMGHSRRYGSDGRKSTWLRWSGAMVFPIPSCLIVLRYRCLLGSSLLRDLSRGRAAG